jgi:hypothetical protein
MGMDRDRKAFLLYYPVHQAVFSSLEEFLNGYGFASCKPASVSTLNDCCASVRNSSQYRHMQESAQPKLKRLYQGGEEGVEQRHAEADQCLHVARDRQGND